MTRKVAKNPFFMLTYHEKLLPLYIDYKKQ